MRAIISELWQKSSTPLKRANAVFKEFNISFETLVETLKKKGIEPPKSPNDRVSEERAYFVLQRGICGRQKNQRGSREKNSSNLQPEKKESITIDKVKKRQEEEKLHEEKNYY
ncbi:MAG: hypothetical protein KatS3mg028_0749 [Bacteroidia bacterium]|nr:MAG: hypothetical protein KatS3mg028_0749 [Bacteroidia bacterium]